jgi:hypothetical protein
MKGTGSKFKSLYLLRILTDVAAQIISGFLSFGSLHIHTTGFEPWQWYDQAQHLTNALTFLKVYDHHGGTYPHHGAIVLVSILKIS